MSKGWPRGWSACALQEISGPIAVSRKKALRAVARWRPTPAFQPQRKDKKIGGKDGDGIPIRTWAMPPTAPENRSFAVCSAPPWCCSISAVAILILVAPRPEPITELGFDRGIYISN